MGYTDSAVVRVIIVHKVNATRRGIARSADQRWVVIPKNVSGVLSKRIGIALVVVGVDGCLVGVRQRSGRMTNHNAVIQPKTTDQSVGKCESL